MAILVVGGAGYIGSHMVKTLKKNNLEVVVFDNLEKGHIEAVQNTPFYKGDLRNKDEVAEVFKKHEITAVMHFSAYSLVGESMEKPEIYYENNVYGTLNLLAAMNKAGVTHFIFSSTAATFGEPVKVPIDENHPQKPTNVYGETKLAVEKMLDWFEEIYGIKNVKLRYFNAAGADPSGEIGEYHETETHLIPIILQAALGERDHITIYGSDYDTKDGTCIRDYIHINDLADAHLLALKYLEAGNSSTAFNLGNGSGYSVKEVIDVAKKVTGKEIKVIEGNRRPGDPAILIAGSQKAKDVLGWKPELYDIGTIVETAWKWHNGTAKKWIKNKNKAV